MYICKEVHHSYEQKAFHFQNIDPGRRVCSFNNCFLSLVSTEGKIHFKMVWLVMCPYGVPDIDAIRCCIPQIPTAVLTCCLKTRKLWKVVFPMYSPQLHLWQFPFKNIIYNTSKERFEQDFENPDSVLSFFCRLECRLRFQNCCCVHVDSLMSELFSGSSSYCSGVLVFFGSQISSDDRNITCWSLKICLKL